MNDILLNSRENDDVCTSIAVEIIAAAHTNVVAVERKKKRRVCASTSSSQSISSYFGRNVFDVYASCKTSNEKIVSKRNG